MAGNPCSTARNDRFSRAGTRSSNPASSSGESANFRSLARCRDRISGGAGNAAAESRSAVATGAAQRCVRRQKWMSGTTAPAVPRSGSTSQGEQSRRRFRGFAGAAQCQREHGRRQCIQRFGCHSGILLNTSRRDGDRVSIQFDQDPWRLARESGGFAPSKPSSCAPKRRPMTRQTTAGGRWIRTSGSGRPQRGCLRRMIWRRPEGSFRRVAHARQHL